MRPITSALRRSPYVRDLIRQFRLRWQRFQRSEPSYWLGKVIQNEKAFVVQIGSNDGKTNDPIYPLLQKHDLWTALFVEPVPYLFNRLRNNYGEHSRFRFINAAINDGNTATFYWVDEAARNKCAGLPDWFDQLGSFDCAHISRHLDGKLMPFIRQTKIEGKSLPELFYENGVARIDLLHIDTEGHDWQILSQLDLRQITPRAILYEHKHLSKEDKANSIQFLASRYEIFSLGGDFLAVNRQIGDDVQTSLSLLRRRNQIPFTHAGRGDAASKDEQH